MSRPSNFNLQTSRCIGRELIIIALIYTGLTAVITWPVVIHLFDKVAGFDGRDSLQWVWFNWWGVKSLLALQSNPAQVTWLYYPQGASHPILLATIFVPLLAIPVTLAGGVRFAYNLVFLTSFVLGGMLTYLLVLSLTRQRAAAFVAGLIFIFAPNRMGHALAGHLLLITTWSLPLYALAFIYLLRRPTWRWALVGSIALTVLTLTQPIHLVYFALPFSLVYGGITLLTDRGIINRFRYIWPYLAGMVVLTTILLLPFFSPLLKSTLQGEQEFFTNIGLEEHSTDLLAFVLPSPYHPLWQGGGEPPVWLSTIISSHRQMEERLAYLGVLPLALAIWAVVRRQRGLYPWLVLVLVAAILAMGPSLKILDKNTGLSLPYHWLMDLPFLRWSRTPGRLNETTALALAVMAAFGLADLLARLRSPRQQWLITAFVTLLIIFDYLVFFPFPMGVQKTPAFYSRLAIEPPLGPVLDMPATGSRRASNYSLLYQTTHNRPIVGGYVERDPPGTAELAQFFDRLLSPSPAHAVVAGTPGLETRRQILQQSGVQQVVARRWLMTDQAATATLSFMPDVLGEPYYADEELLAWRTPPAAEELPPYTLLLSEKRWETSGDGLLVRLKEKGLLFVYTAQADPAVLTVELQDGSPGQQLWIGDCGPLPTLDGGTRYDVPLQLQAGFNWIPFRLSECQDCEATFSHISIN